MRDSLKKSIKMVSIAIIFMFIASMVFLVIEGLIGVLFGPVGKIILWIGILIFFFFYAVKAVEKKNGRL